MEMKEYKRVLKDYKENKNVNFYSKFKKVINLNRNNIKNESNFIEKNNDKNLDKEIKNSKTNTKEDFKFKIKIKTKTKEEITNNKNLEKPNLTIDNEVDLNKTCPLNSYDLSFRNVLNDTLIDHTLGKKLILYKNNIRNKTNDKNNNIKNDILSNLTELREKNNFKVRSTSEITKDFKDKLSNDVYYTSKSDKCEFYALFNKNVVESEKEIDIYISKEYNNENSTFNLSSKKSLGSCESENSYKENENTNLYKEIDVFKSKRIDLLKNKYHFPPKNKEIKRKEPELIISATFSSYIDGLAYFVNDQDTIFNIPIPLVGMQLIQGCNYTFNFNKKENYKERLNRVITTVKNVSL